MTKQEDIERLNNLMLSQPENEEQRILKDQLIYSLRVKLGHIQPEHTAMAVNGDIDDIAPFLGKSK